MSYDREPRELRTDRARRWMTSDQALEAPMHEEPPVPMPPVHTSEMAQILDDVARDRQRPAEKRASASEIAYGPTPKHKRRRKWHNAIGATAGRPRLPTASASLGRGHVHHPVPGAGVGAAPAGHEAIDGQLEAASSDHESPGTPNSHESSHRHVAHVAHEGAHAEHHEQAHEGNPFLAGLGTAENVHLGYEALTEGGHLIADLPKHALEVLEGEASVGQAVSAYAGLLLSPFAIGAGIHEIDEGAKEFGHDTAGGTITMAEGTLGVAAGGGSLLGSAGIINPAWGAAAASAKAGLEIGHYSDKHAKELGVFHDDEGRAETASQWAADQSFAAQEWTRRNTGNETLAALAGGAAFVGTVVAATNTALQATAADAALKAGTAATTTAVTIGSGLTDIGSAMGTRAARSQRAASYAGLTMNGEAPVVDRIGFVDPKTGQVVFETADAAGRMRGGERMALEDENRERAIARSRLLFPERWGLPPNPVSITHHVAMAAKRGSDK